jgi:septal ring factor EnvC (AmiA/AmiB activator)
MGLKAQIKFTLLLIMLVFFAGAAYEEIINDKNRQSDYIEKQITDYKTAITKYSAEVSGVNKHIDSVEAEINALNEFLKNSENDVYISPGQIAAETQSVNSLTDEVARIQESFKQKVINLYKHGENYELELLLSSKTPNEFLRRNQYLQKFSQNRKRELRDLKSKKFILEEKKKMLTLSTSSQRIYIEAKRSERKILTGRLNELKAQKDAIEYQSNLLTNKILRYETQLRNIENFINNFSDNKENYKGAKTNRLNYESGDLGKIKGNINLPLDAGLVVTAYGDNINNSTNTLTFNNGVDFSVAKGTKVYSVASGIVSLVGELPYYGQVVIIKHDNGYRSVYASLSDADVIIGENIRLNQVIGKTGETLDGQSLHFELWLNTTPLNSSEWLRF